MGISVREARVKRTNLDFSKSAVILNGFTTNYFQRSDSIMKKKKINPQEFDCGCCGNQIYKSRLRDEVKCCYCGYINHVGKYTGRRKRLG